MTRVAILCLSFTLMYQVWMAEKIPPLPRVESLAFFSAALPDCISLFIAVPPWVSFTGHFGW